ncbi:MFS transporter [Paenarthrobacter sp. PH39-S1]|uniref:MFS transporter n=1 Tax=Paenarthrobacter sp. PH39-S1 TaxID=3046204 RepID=UPI0024B91E56|nr:MFS transporter [Paenarthrobacter sp. PH39-S1]MDJ0356693.1 MFS transporter [Paenarthrobacter sp. PH39-S1]
MTTTPNLPTTTSDYAESATDQIAQAGPREWLGLAVLALGALITSIDVSVAILALPRISETLDANSSEQLWILDSYGFLMASLMVTFGSIADRIGRRKMAMMGAGLFGLASIAAAFSATPLMLIGARSIMGVGAAALSPALFGLLTTMFRNERQRSTALGVFMTCFMGGMLLGPVVGGVLLSRFGWGSVFLVGVPVMLLLVLLCPILVPEYRGVATNEAGQVRTTDWLSALLSLLAILPVVYGLKEFARSGMDWTSVLSILAGLAFSVVFVRRQRLLSADARREPLLDLTMFRSRGFLVVLLSLMLMTMMTGPMMMLNTQYFQLVSGESPLASGLLTLPAAATSAGGFIVMPLIARRIRPGLVISGGISLIVIGLMVMALISPTTGPWPLVVGFALVSFGSTPLPTLGTNLIVGSVPLDKASSAASTSETSGQLGYSLGIAVLGSIVTAVYRMQLPHVAGLSAAEQTAAQESIAGAGMVWSESSEPVATTLRDATALAFCSGVQSVAILSAVVMAALAVVTFLTLRRIPAFQQ